MVRAAVAQPVLLSAKRQFISRCCCASAALRALCGHRPHDFLVRARGHGSAEHSDCRRESDLLVQRRPAADIHCALRPECGPDQRCPRGGAIDRSPCTRSPHARVLCFICSSCSRPLFPSMIWSRVRRVAIPPAGEEDLAHPLPVTSSSRPVRPFSSTWASRAPPSPLRHSTEAAGAEAQQAAAVAHRMCGAAPRGSLSLAAAAVQVAMAVCRTETLSAADTAEAAT
jgi:hypothetical protein